MSADERRRRWLLLLILFAGHFLYISFRYQPYTFTWADPGWQVLAAQSVVADADLDIKNQLNGEPARTQNQVAIGRGGQWYNVHEYLLPVISAPVLKIAGLNGLLLFNVAMVITLQFFVYLICSSHVGSRFAFWATLFNSFGTMFLPYSYSYSIDVLGVLLLIISFWLVRERHFGAGGLLAGFAVLGRLTNVLALPWLVLFVMLTARNAERRSSLFHFVAGGLPVAVVFCLMNWQMYGGVFDVGYQHWATEENGKLIVVDQASLFAGPSLENLRGNLFHPRKGLFVSMLLLPLALVGIPAFIRAARHEAVVYLGIAFSFIVFFASFSAWHHTTQGNRYLMPIVALSAIPLGYALQKFFPSLGVRKDRC